LQNRYAVTGAALELGQIRVHERADVGVDESGGSPLEFPEFRRDFMRAAEIAISAKRARR